MSRPEQCRDAPSPFRPPTGTGAWSEPTEQVFLGADTVVVRGRGK
ncbi:hypothetical protein SCATT_05140 [Streptantibioticus cattleyicolor NRRL 8057 = DSM 46488]|uniref:Uncharacterized protein n=1 Tax=Streptantibioticus cattleyicolor (strain ATCC 35852 / DSM 46488 / JCM 4925 / NBRC 14057 / NRRL 8057) TaxID=1003195 RepID=G8WPU6_STREN|nr:hypothetical protein SCATT_05140 [Streptantibioticus cattleyicolor NRRL 8057 = DSM 46488]